ncbi:MBL fold metallo-hydrolase [Saccharomonospora sp. NPDC006951]
MRVHHFNCGTMRPPGGRLLDGKGGLLHRGRMVCHCMLVETGSELVLIDTGMGSPAVTRPEEWLGDRFVRLTKPSRDESETAVSRIRALGFDPADVGHVVLTHLDLDHAGGLVDFPDATVHVFERELRALHNPVDAAERGRYRTVQFAHGPKFSAYGELGESWFGFDAVRDLRGLPPEILLVPLAGHTRGHAGVAVDTGDGWLLNAGDSYFFHGQVTANGPQCPPGLAFFERSVQTDKLARIHNQLRLRELVAADNDVTVFCAHDATEFDRSRRD